MLLESLFRLVETLRDRTQRHAVDLRQSEALTRYVLIDPLLRELGWDTEDPEQVRPEYRSGSGSADYALLSDGKPVMMIEAKKLDTSLQDGLVQGINYCLVEGTPYFAVTNGRRWEIYESHKQAPIAEKRLVAFDVASPASPSAVLQALALWRPNIETGKATLPEPLLVSPTNHVLVEVGPADVDVGGAWVPLTQLQPKKRDSAPQSLRFPDGSQAAIGKWGNLPLEVVRWLVGNGSLTAEKCPIQSGGRYVVSMTPMHPSGKQFLRAKQVGSFHVEANYSASDQFRNALLVLSHVGQNPDQFSVRF